MSEERGELMMQLPERALEIIKGAIDDTYPEDGYENTLVDVDAVAFNVRRPTMPIRIAAAMSVASRKNKRTRLTLPVI